ncbi:MAG: hypothetical protein JO101_08280 [Candidatus Eremiobacteraeota bacterium]|nr:hypothetical protein [Candidatus Eremiobacteraeota bacterium]MBV8355301.1 hypothetical protein [Candidatus Eremiobacteraeota bacterium]
MAAGTDISVDSVGSVAWRRFEALAIFLVSFVLAATVVYHRHAVQRYLYEIGWLAYPCAIALMAVVASAPFSVTDALAVMNGVLFGPVVGSLVNAGGLVVAAIIGYVVAQRTSKLLDLEAQIAKLPHWISRYRIGSPMFLIMVRLLPGIGGTLSTQTAAAYRVGFLTQIWTMCLVAVPICTLLAIFGDGVAGFVHAHVTQPVQTYVVEHGKRIHLPRRRHHSPAPVPLTGPGP